MPDVNVYTVEEAIALRESASTATAFFRAHAHAVSATGDPSSLERVFYPSRRVGPTRIAVRIPLRNGGESWWCSAQHVRYAYGLDHAMVRAYGRESQTYMNGVPDYDLTALECYSRTGFEVRALAHDVICGDCHQPVNPDAPRREACDRCGNYVSERIEVEMADGDGYVYTSHYCADCWVEVESEQAENAAILEGYCKCCGAERDDCGPDCDGQDMPITPDMLTLAALITRVATRPEAQLVLWDEDEIREAATGQYALFV